MPAVVSAISGVFAAVSSSAIGSIALRLLGSVALSALSQALAPKPKPSGLRTENTLSGGTTPEAFMLGATATGGTFVCPPMSHGSAGKTPNAFLTYVIELAGIPGHQLDGLILNGERVAILADAPHPDYGQRLGGAYEGRAWIRYHDGSQTTADAMLLAKYPAPFVRPWSADMVGAGICYAVLTFRYDREVFQGWPQCRFELSGVPLYDPRRDSSVGGEGAHRWGQPATYEPSNNTAVQIYNAARGIALPSGDVWGGEIPAEDLPLAVWIAAMNIADTPADDGAAGTEPAFRSGIEVQVADEPFSVIEELLKGCNGAMTETGGVWSLRLGGPGLPVLFLEDDGIIADEAEDFAPFPPIDQIFNAISATHPDPASLWESRESELRANPAWEAEDGGRRLPTSLSLPTVPYPVQVDRVLAALIADHRRMRRHVMTLDTPGAVLEAGDTIAWSSVANGYDGKLFEVTELSRDLFTQQVRASLREVDPGDYDPPSGLVRPNVPVPAPVRPAVQSVPGFAVSPYVLDVEGEARRAGILALWDPEGADDARGLRITIRRAGQGGDGDERPPYLVPAGMAVITEGLVAGDYEVRARLRVDRPTSWTAWLPVTVADVRLGLVELSTEITGWLGALQEWIDGGVIDLPGELASLGAALSAEAEARATALATEAQARADGLLAAANALAAEAQARAEAIATETMARAAALAAEAEARAAGLLEVSEAVEAEAAARAAALTEEAQARAADLAAVGAELSAETAARVALAQETAATLRDQRDRIRAVALEVVELGSQAHLAREELRQSISAQVGDIRATYDAQILTLADEASALAARLVTLEVSSDDLAVQIAQVDQARIAGDEALGQLITAVSVGTATQFDHTRIWYWDEAPEGWTGDPVAPSVTASGWLRPGAASSVLSPTGLTIAGGAYRQVRARIRRVGAPVWAGALWWAGEGETWDEARRVVLEAPDYDDNIGLLTWAPQWTGAIDRIRIDLADGADASNYFELDWLAIGRPAPGASSAELLAEQVARIAADEAEAAERLLLAARLTGVEGVAEGAAEAAEELGIRVTETEDGIEALSGRTAALEATVDDPTSGLAATAAALETLVSRVEALDDGSQVLLAEAIRNLRSSLRQVALESLEADAQAALETQAVREYIAEASQSLTTRIDATDGTVEVLAEAVTLLQAAIPGLATAEALAALSASVTDQGGILEAVVAAQNSLTVAVSGLTTGQTANGAAIEAVELRTTAAEGELASQGTRLSSVETGVSDLETGQTANGAAIEAVEIRTTAAEGELASQGSRLSSVETGVSDLETGQAANGAAIEAVEVRTTAAEGGIEALSGRTATLEATVDDPTSGLAATAAALETLVSRVEALDDGSQVLLAEAIRNLRSSLRQAALESLEAGAQSALQTQAVREYIAEASQILTTRIDTIDGAVEVLAEAVTLLQAAIPGLATAEALAALSASVTDQGGLLEAVVAAQNSLTVSVEDLTTGLAANGAAIDAVEVRTTAAEGEIASQGTRLSSVETGVSDLETGQAANGAAIEAVEVRTTAAEGEIASQGTRLSSVETGVSDLETGQAANGAAIEAVELRTTAAEGEIASQGTRLSSVETGVSDLETGQAANGAAIEAVELRTTAAEGELASQGSRLSSVETGVSDLETGQAANGAAIEAVELRTTAAEGEIASQGTRLSSVETGVSDLETGQAANGAAIEAVELRTTAAEGEIAAQGTRLSSVETGVSDLETGQAANGAAIEAVEVRATAAEGEISSQGTRLSSVETGVSDLETGQAANGAAIEAVEVRTTAAEGEIASQGTRLSSVETGVLDLETGQAANGAAIEAVEVRTTAAEGEIASLVVAQTALTADLAGKADASVVAGLTAQVTEIDGEVTALSGATTIVQAAVQGANLIANGSFAGGTLTGWAAVAPGMMVIARDPGSVTPAEALAPTPHVLRIYQSASAQTADVAVAVPVTPGEMLRASLLRAASGGTRNVTLSLSAIWLDASGAAVGAPQTLLTTLVTATAWARATGDGVTVPAGTVAVTLRLTRAGGGAGNGWVTGLKVERDGLGLSDITASGLFRMEAAAGPSGYSRLRLVGRTSTAEAYREAGLYIDTPVNPAEPSRVAIAADQFTIIGPDGAVVPFIIDGDRIYLTGSAIRLTGDTEVDGSFVIRSGTSGGRVEISQQGISVYDAAGVLRIRLGWLGLGL
ncbi:hypothetical protein [Pararhodobacter aggregans]|uniref:Tip attachment protein J domain-containing protein n=1 Tax=Pararhodobacter aggregans TaxID=404875 RepID=A0A2T7URG1_9RHOB|nr:hypothetical protein [Pararhodobacter aggregans]PTX02072.1 hypothetical protein C8N33_106291 [Pararhodobacter aggregans]PVE47244.1 hypothetical protein DDE23_13475 [Pararhodobacter aggregans]